MQPSVHLMPKASHKPCCYNAALDEDATFCGECGSPLMRCMVYDACAGLLDEHGLCSVCVSPIAFLNIGAPTRAAIGDALALPFIIANGSDVDRPVFITNAWSREGDGDWRELNLSWERLESGERRPMTVRADQLRHAGVHNVQIMLAVSSRWRWREERFAYIGSASIEVEAGDKNGPVVNIGGQSAGHGNTVYISGQDKTKAASALTEPRQIPLVRAEREERKMGVRGYDEHLWTPRSAPIQWRGFPKAETPFDGPIVTSDGLLGAGRTRARAEGGLGDIRLLAETQDGKIDEGLSRMISRRHFELYIERDRLMLRVTGSGGLRINGEALGANKTAALVDGDVIAPLVKAEEAFQLAVGFDVEHGKVSAVTITRTPTSKRLEASP